MGDEDVHLPRKRPHRRDGDAGVVDGDRVCGVASVEGGEPAVEARRQRRDRGVGLGRGIRQALAEIARLDLVVQLGERDAIVESLGRDEGDEVGEALGQAERSDLGRNRDERLPPGRVGGEDG